MSIDLTEEYMRGPSLFICPLWTEGWNGHFRQMPVDGDSMGCPLLSIHSLERQREHTRLTSSSEGCIRGRR